MPGWVARDRNVRTKTRRGEWAWPRRSLDFPVFDADNHMYETTDAFTKFLPPEYEGLIQYVEVNGTHQDRGQGTDQRVHPQSHLRGGGSPGRPGGVLQAAAIPRESPVARSWASPSGRCPPSGSREPRLELMDELGLDRALMWPTLASLLEERLRGDPRSTHAVVHALNQWMHEHWTFNYENRIFPTPVIHLGIVDKAIEELEWVLDRGARIVLIRPAPVVRIHGAPLAGPPRVRPVLEAGGRGRHPGGHARLGQRVPALHQRVGGGAGRRDDPVQGRDPGSWPSSPT